LLCVDAEVQEGQESEEQACDPGYSLGSDDQTCIANGPECDRGEVLDDDGQCVKTFRCPDGQILASDLLSCLSDRCPDGELLSVDGKRCVAPDSDCPDGSPRPLGGACLVVETVEGADGTTQVVVRCAEADSFCQARIKQCADDQAAGASDLGSECADPRGSCDPNDTECAESNDRLVECATRDLEEGDEGDDAEPVSIGGSNDPCADLCPELHRLDPSGECVEFLDPKHPCVSFGQIPAGVTTNEVLDGYSYLAGTGQCVTRVEFLRRLGNFEAAAGAEADALTLLRETTSSYLTIEGQLAELDQLLITAERDVRAFMAGAAQADLDRENNAKLLLFTQKRLEREEALLREEVVQVFVVGGNDALIEEAILSATNVTEISVAQTYGQVLLDDQVANISLVEDLENQTRELSIALDRAVNEVDASLTSAVASAEGLEVLREEATALRKEQLARRDEEAELVAELRENKAAFAQELGVFEQATREIADIIADTEFRVTTFAEFDGLLANPILPRTVITSGFGPRLHPILGYVRSHNGVDVTAGFGEEIVASGPGIVQIASAFGGYGNTVVIDHGGGLLTLYAHMSVVLVEAGEELELGDTIGLVGSTGLSTGPHLHFEVWEEGDTAVDPRPYLSDAG
jgi:murein DD-endopeptidase MepM/ murein hydrolase activator NlpD